MSLIEIFLFKYIAIDKILSEMRDADAIFGHFSP